MPSANGFVIPRVAGIYGVGRLGGTSVSNAFKRNSSRRLTVGTFLADGEVTVAFQVHGAYCRDKGTAGLVEGVVVPVGFQGNFCDRQALDFYFFGPVLGQGVFHSVAQGRIQCLCEGVRAALDKIQGCFSLVGGFFDIGIEFVFAVMGIRSSFVCGITDGTGGSAHYL